MDKGFGLYFGPLKIGRVIQTDSDFPNLWGNITYDPALGNPQMAEVSRFIALNRECTRLADMEQESDIFQEQEAVNTELEAYYLSYVESEDWHLIDEQGDKLPILCPIFRGDSEIVWRWNSSGA